MRNSNWPKTVFSALIFLTLLPAWGKNDLWQASWQEEQLYQHFKHQLQSGSKNLRITKQLYQFNKLNKLQEALFVDALIDLDAEEEADITPALQQQNWQDFTQIEEQIRIATLQYTMLHWPFPEILRQKIQQQLTDGTFSERAYLLSKELPLPFPIDWSQYPDYPLPEWSQKWPKALNFQDKTPQELRDLFNYQIPSDSFHNGAYAKTPKIFLFCRHLRAYPCLMLMKDTQDRPVRNSNGELWSQPALGLSAKNLDYANRSGNTPSGIHLINSVMPSADNPKAFGKFRRLILNWVPNSEGELLHRQLLPASARNANWWKEAVLARDIGRNLLRIHGTGRINKNPQSSYFPLTPTSGCISQRENTYRSVSYKDQRKLLDQLMLAEGLEAKYKNEPSIFGVLYLIEINSLKKAVTLAELQALLGI